MTIKIDQKRRDRHGDSVAARMFAFVALTCRYLLLPALFWVVWGELTPHPPAWTGLLSDKAQHFIGYFCLASMVTLSIRDHRLTLYALVGLVLLGAVLEVLQGYTGRDPDLLDEIANAIGVSVGAGFALGLRWLIQRGAAG